MGRSKVKQILLPEDPMAVRFMESYVSGYVMAYEDLLKDLDKIENDRTSTSLDYFRALDDVREKVEKSLEEATTTMNHLRDRIIETVRNDSADT